MKTLYIISQSPYQRMETLFPFKIADKDDAVLLLQNGVLLCKSVPSCVADDFHRAIVRGVKIYGLKEDFEARGITPQCDVVDYKGAIKLFEQYDRTV